MSIISSPFGGAICNAYATVVDVSSYIETACVFLEPWTDVTTVQANALVIRASRNIDALNWEGEKYFYNQFLEFPRLRATSDDISAGLSRGVPADPGFFALSESDEYLRQQKINVQCATAEQAYFLALSGGRLPHRSEQFQGIGSTSRSVRVGASFSYATPGMVLCPEAWDYLRQYVGTMRIVRG